MPNFLLTMSMLSVAAGAGLRFEAMPEATEQCIGDGDACQEIGTSQCCPGLICLQFLNQEMACVTPPDSGAAAAGRAAACALECIADPESDKCQECYHKASAAAEAAAPCSGDEAILSTTKFLCDAVSCAKKNFLGIAGTVKCMEAADKVSESCATCFTKVTKCIATHCALKCIADPESDKCLECGHEACDAIAKTCVPAGTSLPPNPKNCKSASLAVAATQQCGGYHAFCASGYAPCCAPLECAGPNNNACVTPPAAAAPAEAKATAAAEAAAPCSGDEAILSTTKFSCDVVTCAKKNSFGIAGTAKCMEAADQVSESCATCFAKVAKCSAIASATKCANECLADPESDKCQECRHKNCDAIAKTCVPAGTNLPPNPKNCKSVSLELAAEAEIVEVSEDHCAPGMPYRYEYCSEECSWYGNDGCNADCSCKSTPLWMRLGNVLTTLV